MMERPKRVTWKIVVGCILLFVAANNLSLYQGGSTQANAGIAMSAVAIIGGLWLIYRGLYP